MKSVTNLWARTPQALRWAFLLLGLALLLLSSNMLYRVRINFGYIVLNKALATDEAEAINQALANLSGFTAGSPASQEAWRGAALAQMALGNRDEAAESWMNVEGFEEELVTWGTRAEQTDQWATAQEWYHITVTLAPRNGDHWYRLARVSAQLGDSRTVDYYQQALLAPDRTEFGRSNILTRLGELEKRDAPIEWGEVLAQFDEAIQQDDFVDERDLVQAWLGKAEALDRLGQTRTALETYEWVAEYRPGYYWANVHSGRLVWLVEKNADKAIEYLEKAIEINGESKWAFLNLGIVYAQSDNPHMSIPFFKKVLDIDPNDVVAHTQLSRLTGSDGP